MIHRLASWGASLMLRLKAVQFSKPLLAICLVGAILSGAPALAAELDHVSSLNLEVHGTVTERCGIGSPGDVNLGDLNYAGRQAEFKFGLECNVPFVMTVSAEHGSLTNREFPAGQGPYAGKLPYQIDLSIPVRKPGSSIVRRSFKSADLAGGGQSFSSSGGIATEGMEARVTIGAALGEAGLLAGDYSETISVTLSMI